MCASTESVFSREKNVDADVDRFIREIKKKRAPSDHYVRSSAMNFTNFDIFYHSANFNGRF